MIISTFTLIWNSIVTQNHILDDVYESWNAQPLVAGSDSADDECEEVVEIVEADGSDGSDDFDKPLASSIGNLNLFDPPQGHKVVDCKGKGRAIPRTPSKPRTDSLHN